MSEWVKKGEYGELPPIIDKMNYLKDTTDYLLSLTGKTNGTSGTSGIGEDGTSGTSGIGEDGTSGTSGIGEDGTSGTSGIGEDGTSGTSGTSGIGEDGTSGTSGTSGIGEDGTSGTSGVDASGIFGGNSVLYNFNTNTKEDSPNAGYLKINNTSPSIATKLLVDYRNIDGNFIDTWLRSISSNTSSYFRLFIEDNSSIFCIYKILGMVDNGILSKYVTFDVEIVYADNNNFFQLDDKIVLSYTESGGSNEASISIPKLKIDTGYYTSPVVTSVVTDTIRGYWDSINDDFLNYNPEIWVFRRKTYSRKNSTTDGIIRHKKWTHEPHLNGVKFPNSKYYSGSITCPVAEIQSTGRHTEFELSPSGKTVIPLEPFDYIYGYLDGDLVKFSDETDFNKVTNIQVTGRKRGKSLPLRFAIVIDNPDTSSSNPKIIGDLSDIVYMRYGNGDGNGCVIKYLWNEIGIDMFKTGRF